jgi:phytoene desaturase
MYSITSALINLAKQHQVDLCSNSEAVKIQKENGKTIGVKLQSGQEITADVVIDNAYIGSKRKKRLIKESPSAVLIYIGINGKLPKLKTHNLFFAPNWPAQFKHLQKSKILPRNPSFYVHTLESDLAPKDKTGLFVIVPVPNQARPDKTAVNKLVDRIIEAVAVSSENPELRKQIILRKILGPDDFISRYGSSSMLGPSHTFWQTGPFRPQNKSKKVKGLYFAGANTVPGVGVPMCLISGQLVAERIMSDLKG